MARPERRRALVAAVDVQDIGSRPRQVEGDRGVEGELTSFVRLQHEGDDEALGDARDEGCRTGTIPVVTGPLGWDQWPLARAAARADRGRPPPVEQHRDDDPGQRRRQQADVDGGLPADLAAIDHVDAGGPGTQPEATSGAFLPVLVVSTATTAAPGHVGGGDHGHTVLADRLPEDPSPRECLLCPIDQLIHLHHRPSRAPW